MKGGSNIKIKLKFIGTGYNNDYQACVKIYDFNTLLYQKQTYNGKLTINLKENKLYKIVASSCDETINTSIYITKNSQIFIFKFNRGVLQNNYPTNIRTITFLLNDANYDNLPVEKGEMFLWQKQ